MKAYEQRGTERFERRRNVSLPDGDVEIFEREWQDTVVLPLRKKRPATRLIVDEAVTMTRGFISKARSEIGELSTLLQELTESGIKAR